MNKPIQLSKCYTQLSVIYTVLGLATAILIYKIIRIGGIAIPASTLIIPFWFTLADLITEIYGYQASRKLLSSVLIGEFIFICLICLLIRIPSPQSDIHQQAYEIVFSKLPRVFLGGCAAIILGGILNIYFVSKWKVLLVGRYFWLRSMGSSLIGETIFTFVAFLIEFWNIVPLNATLKMATSSLIIKLIFLPIAVFPTAILCKIIKDIENINENDSEEYYDKFNSLSKLIE